MRPLALILCLAAIVAAPAFADPAEEEKALRSAWDALAKDFAANDLDKVAGHFSKEATAWLESAEGLAAYKPLRGTSEDELKGTARVLRLEPEAASKLEPGAFAKRYAAGLAAWKAEELSKSRVVKVRADGELRMVEVQLERPSEGDYRAHFTFSREGDGWKLSKSWVAHLHEYVSCCNLVYQVGIHLALFESKFKEYPGELGQLKESLMAATGNENALKCPLLGDEYVYLFPLEGDMTPPGRLTLYDRKPHADGTRLAVMFAGTPVWLDEAQFQEWLRKDLDVIQAKLPEVEKKVKADLETADGQKKANLENYWMKGLTGLRSVIKREGK
ncbi:MAG: hypothetical protein K8T20_07755 [Planctomycetes bacterium]|nr:hypothetical protein [Planctomycetota bacterium]